MNRIRRWSRSAAHAPEVYPAESFCLEIVLVIFFVNFLIRLDNIHFPKFRVEKALFGRGGGVRHCAWYHVEPASNI